MLFVCCDEKIPQQSRLVLALKTLCGFSTGEIAFRLFTTEANVYKRLARAREWLRQVEVDTQTPPLESLRSRLPSVHAVIYLLFNEGYLSTHAEHAIRAELCEEAIRLATLLATICGTPSWRTCTTARATPRRRSGIATRRWQLLRQPPCGSSCSEG